MNPPVVLSPAAVQCPTCKATERTCRTRTGAATKTHVSRVKRAADISDQMNNRSVAAQMHASIHAEEAAKYPPRPAEH